ncbi:SAM-dependent methyltransferase [Nocardia mangyaensis]|uniref:SAM-dependent methyltransferase n=1 Tax=Nocardia mangyaensis TaxID=2213200 RepID=A0A1J0VT75_9NOCA|nr:cyclopropane-fatty-acyl-phospholipid synthase family protein [Nocardia mangyaensis]APE35237.1 SAM-dependent methyltransferase [Nocardia mangyaensis]
MGDETTIAAVFEPLIRAALGPASSVRFEFWDGSAIEPGGTCTGTMRVRSQDALSHLVWAPGELGLARAFVSGTVDLDGDIFAILRSLQSTASDDARLGLGAAWKAIGAARELGALTRRPPPPPEEARPRRGRRHSRGRDAAAISHHYDVGNDFYRLVLGPSMTYSCARFVGPDDDGHGGADGTVTLADAQAAKHDLVCRKLGLAERPGMRLLDVGCGWGSMAMHAASVYDARVVGVTISGAQAQLARRRVDEAGLGAKVEIRLSDYRELGGEEFDAISSIGMFEHVGTKRAAEYFDTLRALLPPGGRLLNHAISSPGGSTMTGRSFIGRYVFPDGELIDVGEVVLAMQRAGFEVRDVEALREHYALTLRRWVANLEGDWDRAVALSSAGRARIWRLYMAASALGFEDGGLGIHQVLGVVPDARGWVGMPGTRRVWG